MYRRRFRRMRFRAPRYKPYRRNLLLDFIKAYVVFFLIIGGMVFFISRLGVDNPDKKNPSSSTPNLASIKRSEAFKRGMEMINYTWTYDPEKNGIVRTDEVVLPDYLKESGAKRVSGIPYAWGGLISLDISNQKGVKNFKEAIEMGYTAGNVLCKGEYKELTAGLDCSGFVSAVFKIKEKIKTSEDRNYFHEISKEELKPMDILSCKGYHVLIYLGETSDGKGIIAMEATTGTSYSSPEKTVITYRSWNELEEGKNGEKFIPLRYNKIIEDEVELFRDKNEPNNHIKRAIETSKNSSYSGYIDYVEDVDYFKHTVDKKDMILIKVIKLPEKVIGEVLSESGNVILRMDKEEGYSLEIPGGTYYIRFSGKDLFYDPEGEYQFQIGE